ncbi:unnamed protein product [Miscanthus lutarioriparius]|uniref:NB-ARC domain-containing protein n=1 Tax=Miscanthus lutarioriparius TaxID=422564 RepID=A0A811NGP5_9POAL|nr:unnamed protein product [Miscanthus lutarioriparius]
MDATATAGVVSWNPNERVAFRPAIAEEEECSTRALACVDVANKLRSLSVFTLQHICIYNRCEWSQPYTLCEVQTVVNLRAINIVENALITLVGAPTVGEFHEPVVMEATGEFQIVRVCAPVAQTPDEAPRNEGLRVIVVWGTSGVLSQTVVIKGVYDDLKRSNRFEQFAWIRIVHPFNPLEFLQCIMRQFYETSFEVGKTQEKTNIGAQVLKKMGMMKQDDLVDAFSEYVNEKSYLIVLNDLSTVEEWDAIKKYFPDNKKGSRIIVSTEHGEVASLCAGQECTVSELNQSSVYQSIFGSKVCYS